MKHGNGASEINKSSEVDFSETILDLTSARNSVRQVKKSDGSLEAQDAGTLVLQLSEAPRGEIERIVGTLTTLLRKLETEGVRIQLDIEDYAKLNQRVMQLTEIVVNSVERLPIQRVD